MGLDIYVRWGNTNEDGEIIDGMTPEERQAQITGYADATSAGYLRYNWPGVRFVGESAAALGIPSPIDFLWQDWEGSNGETCVIDAAQLARLSESRKEITEWLASVPATISTVIPDASERDYFLGKMRATVGMIDFILAHKDRKGLRVEFN